MRTIYLSPLFLLTLLAGVVSPLHAADPASVPTVDRVWGICALRQTIVVQAQGLSEWANKNNPLDLLLYLNGLSLKGVKPEIDLVFQNKLVYKLERDPANAANVQIWNGLFGRPQFGASDTVRVTVGPEGKPFPVVGDQTVGVQSIQTVGFWIYVALFLGLLCAVVQLARYSDLLRDPGPAIPGSPKTFSLARTQMTFWFLLIVAAYGFIWLATGATDTITPSVLGLMGISAATGLAGVVVDSSKQTKADADLAQLKSQLASLQVEQTQQGANFPAARLQVLNDLSAEISKRQQVTWPAKSQGFLNDILSDANGVSFHRLQIGVWTIVLGIIFSVAVYNSLSMPTFSDTLLGLMAISGGTYIGFKIPEAQS